MLLVALFGLLVGEAPTSAQTTPPTSTTASSATSGDVASTEAAANAAASVDANASPGADTEGSDAASAVDDADDTGDASVDPTDVGPEPTAAAPPADAPATTSPSAPEATTEPSSSPTSTATPPSPPSSSRSTSDPDVTAWRARAREVLTPPPGGELDTDAIDATFLEIDRAVWPYLDSVHEALHDDAPDTFVRRESLASLYHVRSALFHEISPELHAELTGLGSRGRKQLRNELRYLRVGLELQGRAVTGGTGLIVAQLFEAPLTVLWHVVQVLIALVLFRGWRRWASTGLRDLRSRLLGLRPQRAGNVLIARWLWYFDRVRNPIEWLVLVIIASNLVRPRGYEGVADLVFTVLLWLLLARFAVLWIDAMVTRGVGGLRSERSGLRLRSLRLVAAWSVVLGLGLDITSSYAGGGVIHTWVVRIWQILSVPVALLLIRWWREEVFERLEKSADGSERARSIARLRRGPWSYAAVVIGAGFLLWEGMTRALVRRLSGFEWGRRVLVVLVRREVARDVDAGRSEDEGPIDPELATRLAEGEAPRLDDPTSSQRERIVNSLAGRPGGALVLLGERGSGKTTLLERVGEEVGPRMRIVTCPPGGFDALCERLAAEFGIELGEDFPRLLDERLAAEGVEVIALDDAHLLTRPSMGGQRDLDRLVGLDAHFASTFSWVLVMDRRAWPYVSLARGDRFLLHDTIEMPAWSEEQLAELLATRCQAADVEPDFGRLVLPRQLDAREHESLSERNRLGYSRLLWEMADGNPEVATDLFVASLRSTPTGKVVVRLPQTPISLALDSHVATLLVLRVIVQCDLATVDDIAASLRYSPARVESELQYCHQNGWLETLDGRERVRIRWFRTITRALVRKNLMPR